MYASMTPRDLNHDPEPMIDPFSGLRFPVADELLGYEYHPGPEFDHAQHNQPNPVLVAFRAYSDKHGMDAGDRANLSGAWLQAPGYYESRLVEGRLSRQERDHARRVLTRLANLAQIGAIGRAEEEPTPDPAAEDYGKYLDQQFWGDRD